MKTTFARQAIEWGMFALQSIFPRLKDRIGNKERRETKISLSPNVELFNIRVKVVNINELPFLYMPELSLETNHFQFSLKH